MRLCEMTNYKDKIPEKHVVPAVSDHAPMWSGIAVMDLKLQYISMLDFVSGYVVLLFYPSDFSFACPNELVQFSNRVKEFNDIVCSVVAISTDSELSHLAWITTPRIQGGLGEIKIPLLGDTSQKIARSYGVLDEKKGIAHRAMFIIDRNCMIRHVTINSEDIPRSVDEVLRVVKTCQFVDKHGPTCPYGPSYVNSHDIESNYFEIN